jgi:hypothetical protein
MEGESASILETLLKDPFCIRGKMRTLARGRSQVNIIKSCKREHSKKPDELYEIVEACSPGPYLELFARVKGQPGPVGNEVEEYVPNRPTYANHSRNETKKRCM